MTNEQQEIPAGLPQGLAGTVLVSESNKTINNCQLSWNVLWQGINLYYIQKIKGENFAEEDKQLMQKYFQDLSEAIKPIIDL